MTVSDDKIQITRLILKRGALSTQGHRIAQTAHCAKMKRNVISNLGVDKAPRLGISIVIWILSSDTVTICQLNQFNTNSEAAMLSSAAIEPAMSELLLSVVSGFVDMSVPVPTVSRRSRRICTTSFVPRGAGDVE